MNERLKKCSQRQVLAMSLALVSALYLPLRFIIGKVAEELGNLPLAPTPPLEWFFRVYGWLERFPGWYGLVLALPLAWWWHFEFSEGRRLRVELGLDQPPAPAPPVIPGKAAAGDGGGGDYSSPSGVDGSLFQTPNLETLARRKKVFGRFGMFFVCAAVGLLFVTLLPLPEGYIDMLVEALMWVIGGGACLFFWWLHVERLRDKKVRDMLREAGADIVVDNVWRTRDGNPVVEPPRPKEQLRDGWRERE